MFWLLVSGDSICHGEEGMVECLHSHHGISGSREGNSGYSSRRLVCICQFKHHLAPESLNPCVSTFRKGGQFCLVN